MQIKKIYKWLVNKKSSVSASCYSFGYKILVPRKEEQPLKLSEFLHNFISAERSQEAWLN